MTFKKSNMAAMEFGSIAQFHKCSISSKLHVGLTLTLELVCSILGGK
jgi:hypothetical protein